MKTINFKAEVQGTFEEVIEQVTNALKGEGFGILTRIDLDRKVKEKLGKELEPVAILGACNPELAYEAYRSNPDVASLLPCNAVVRQMGPGRHSVELARPSAMMELLGGEELARLGDVGDQRLRNVIAHFRKAAA